MICLIVFSETIFIIPGYGVNRDMEIERKEMVGETRDEIFPGFILGEMESK